MAEPLTRILVVDDTDGNRYATVRHLRTAGYEVLEATNGADALSVLKNDRVDLAVLDINLPDMTGFEIVERLRRMPEYDTVPVLHLSASYTSTEDRARGLERGADGYLTHPIEPVIFHATVRSLLRMGAMDRALRDEAREWQATFDAFSDAVMLIDERANVLRANPAACKLFGDDDVIGHTLAELLTRTFGHAEHPFLAQLLNREQLDRVEVDLGSRSYQVTTRAIANDDGKSRSVMVMEDITDRLTAERERAELLAVTLKAQRDAESANKAKSEFLAVMSHELRTPLNAIGGYASLIELGIRGPVSEPILSDIDRIKKSQLYLMSLINDVLNFAKIESGHLHVDISEFPVGQVVQSMRDFVEPQLREAQIQFHSEECDADLKVKGDSEKVQQVLINLLSNALKFTPKGGNITLRCNAGANAVRIEVSDTGRGIAAEKLQSIFEPFVQLDRRYKREQEGIGLGLAISRELARAMGGELTATSEEGVGSTFALILQLA